jgi:hypothetical protein
MFVEDTLSFRDIGFGPNLTGGDMVERGDNPTRTRLHNLGERDGVIGTEPTPIFLHSVLVSKRRHYGKLV